MLRPLGHDNILFYCACVSGKTKVVGPASAKRGRRPNSLLPMPQSVRVGSVVEDVIPDKPSTSKAIDESRRLAASSLPGVDVNVQHVDDKIESASDTAAAKSRVSKGVYN